MPGPVKSVFIPVNVAMAEMIANLQAENSPLTDFSEGSATRSLLEAWAVSTSSRSAVADQLQLDSFLETATGEALDAQGSNFLVKRLPAVQATGKVKIERESTSGILIIPAGWGQLSVPPAVPGAEAVAVITLQAAEFGNGVGSVEVEAEAVIGGTAGNLSHGTVLTPISPVIGVNSSTGFTVGTAFANGVNEESDDRYRARIPVTVQGRVKGTEAAFLAGGLGVAGVLSVGVIRAGGSRGDGSTVREGHVEVYYQGAAGLLAAVTSAVEEAATINQKDSTFASVSLSAPRGQLRTALEATVYYQPGVNGTALATAVSLAAREFVEGVGIGNTLYYSAMVEAILAIPEVVSIGLPLTKLCLHGESVAGNITAANDSYVHLAEEDTVITAVEI